MKVTIQDGTQQHKVYCKIQPLATIIFIKGTRVVDTLCKKVSQVSKCPFNFLYGVHQSTLQSDAHLFPCSVSILHKSKGPEVYMLRMIYESLVANTILCAVVCWDSRLIHKSSDVVGDGAGLSDN